MRFQDHVVAMTRSAGEALFQSAHAMPEDRTNWKPLDDGRSALEQLQECGAAPAMIPLLLRGEGDRLPPDFVANLRSERRTWKTVDDCEAAYRKNLEPALQAIQDYPDDALDQMIPVPFAGGPLWPAKNVIVDMYWNMVYHMGQINYIQTLYGDKQMHSGM